MSGYLQRGCDWPIEQRDGTVARCERTDLAVEGDGDHICFGHALEWMDQKRFIREIQSDLYITRRRELPSASCGGGVS